MPRRILYRQQLNHNNNSYKNNDDSSPKNDDADETNHIMTMEMTMPVTVTFHIVAWLCDHTP